MYGNRTADMFSRIVRFSELERSSSQKSTWKLETRLVKMCKVLEVRKPTQPTRHSWKALFIAQLALETGGEIVL